MYLTQMLESKVILFLTIMLQLLTYYAKLLVRSLFLPLLRIHIKSNDFTSIKHWFPTTTVISTRALCPVISVFAI